MCYFILLECHHVGRAGIDAPPIGSVSHTSNSVTCEITILVRGDCMILRKTRLKLKEQDIGEYSIREGSVTGCLCPSAGKWHMYDTQGDSRLHGRGISGSPENFAVWQRQDGKPAARWVWARKASASSSRFVKKRRC
jgi:hypothetical protein